MGEVNVQFTPVLVIFLFSESCTLVPVPHIKQEILDLVFSFEIQFQF